MKDTTGRRLRRIMNDRGLKQVDILRLCEPYCEKYGIKMAKNDLSQYINDKVQPKQDKLSILAMALDVSEVWLMGYDVPMEMSQGQSLHISVDKDDVTEEILSLVFEDEKQVKEFMNFYKAFKNTNPNKREAILSLLESPKSDS